MQQRFHDRGITDVDVAGIATDHRVRATVLDAQVGGFGYTSTAARHCGRQSTDESGCITRPSRGWCDASKRVGHD
ncbi:MAG: hypothetical protein LLG14_00665 [Nocardiaceae bacterium]|nr:hypothetical protein [Nocardiaceae bacterium]